MLRRIIPLLSVALLTGALAPPARAYVDLAPTLGRLVGEAQQIALVEVDRFSRENGALLLKKVRDLKGELPAGALKHQVLSTEGSAVPRPILEWAEPGRRGVLLVAGNTALVCLGQGWYQVNASGDGWWRLGADRPDLPLAFHGAVSRLRDAIELMVAGKTAVITVVPHGANDEAASFDLALHRTKWPGLVPVQRMRASLQMPALVIGASANPALVVGPGPAGAEEVPALLEKLKTSDATVRADAAADLGTLGDHATAARAPLEALLADATPRARLAAAAALLRLAPGHERALGVLLDGLAHSDPAVRCQAARAAGLAGPAAAPLANPLATLLRDADERTRWAALETVAILGPAAGGAADAVTKLLDDPTQAEDAADALGRIGAAARPALPRLAKLLAGESVALRWAAVRAMAQIGGEGAQPAVAFMMEQLPRATEVDGYNMLIYLCLLGPDARDALPVIQRSWIKQPALRPAAQWALEPEERFPWLQDGPGGGMQDGAVARYIYEALVHELGDRLRPAARALAQKIVTGAAGTVPQWAYKLLARFPDETLTVLTPALAGDDVVLRERAVVALGYMGASAAPAQPQLAAALAKAPTEREQRLIKWSLRAVRRK